MCICVGKGGMCGERHLCTAMGCCDQKYNLTLHSESYPHADEIPTAVWQGSHRHMAALRTYCL